MRPVLNRLSAPDLNGQHLEQFDVDKLTVEVVHKALEDLFGANADARAAQVFVVNVSLGDRNRPHGAGPVSGWARLLDWWSTTSGVLFITSTGNTGDELPLAGFANYNAADSASEEDMKTAAMRALIDARATRPVLSPAEGINVLSVGAAHGEAAPKQTLPNGARDALPVEGAPSLLSRAGPGIARAVKPDILMPGGRTLASIRSTADGPVLRRSEATLLSGQRAAAPPVAAAAAAFPILRTHGTSNSAALATRLAVRSIDNLTAEDGAFSDGLDREEAALLAKCLLVHAANWGTAGTFALQCLAGQGSWEQQRRTISDLFGYGLVEQDRALGSADHRVTLLDVGLIRRDQGLLYELRPPQSLSPSSERRTIKSTIAWFTPVQATRRLYRQAELFADDHTDNNFSLGLRPVSDQPTDRLSCRGTVWSQAFDGTRAISHDENDRIHVRVSCKETYPGALSAQMEIPYALAVTIEVGAASGIALYDEVLAGIRAEAEVRTRVRA